MCALIETERLILRPPQSGDEIPLNKLINRSQESLKPWVAWAHNTRISTTLQFVEHAVEQWDSNKQSNFPMVIFHKEDACLIGCSGFNEKSNPSVPFYEPGYWLDSNYTGRGLATEFTTALTRYAFGKLKAKRVQISIQASTSPNAVVLSWRLPSVTPVLIPSQEKPPMCLSLLVLTLKTSHPITQHGNNHLKPPFDASPSPSSQVGRVVLQALSPYPQPHVRSSS